MSGSHVLIADIGGTNARFALAEPHSPVPLVAGSVRGYAVADFASLADAACVYLDATGARVGHMVAAVAGRVDGDQVRMTNSPWMISIQHTRDALGLRGMRVVNDFTAQSMAIPALGPADVSALGPMAWDGHRSDGARTYAVLGPGTGLGVGGLLMRDGRAYPLASEGGHVGFAPATAEEIAVLQQLAQEFGRVSIERLVSGTGLVNLHRALGRISGADPGPLQPRDVSDGAARGDPSCVRAVDMFCAVFGAVAGDLVLTLGAWDGVFLSGGLVPRLLPTLRQSRFRDRFEHKGRFAPVMARVPTLAVLHPQPGLLGCAAIAAAGADDFAP